MAAAVAASRAEPTPEVYASWSTVGNALDWAEFTDYSTPGSNGFAISDLLGVAHGDNIADIGTLCREEYESYIDDWMVPNAMGGKLRRNPAFEGRRRKPATPCVLHVARNLPMPFCRRTRRNSQIARLKLPSWTLRRRFKRTPPSTLLRPLRN